MTRPGNETVRFGNETTRLGNETTEVYMYHSMDKYFKQQQIISSSQHVCPLSLPCDHGRTASSLPLQD